MDATATGEAGRIEAERGARLLGAVERYDIGEVIGSGGMGVVYRARDAVLDRDVALELSPEAAERVVLHDWPDNLRGLSRLLHAVEATGAGSRVEVDRLPAWLTADEPAAAPARIRRKSPTREELAAVFEELGGNVSATARHFGRDRKQIYRWLDAYGLREPE